MKTVENPGRERILERIRAGLRSEAFHPPAAIPVGAPIFDPVSNANALERFQAEAKANLMECFLTANPQESAASLTKALDSLPQGEIFVQDDPLLRRLVHDSRSARTVRWSSMGAPSEASQATLTLAEMLIAQTGSIFVTASCGGRGASVVAPCHIVLAKSSQLVPDLETALREASSRGFLDRNSFACVISGSSRTADIEKILVQGAHGPRRVVVILQQA